MERIQIDTPSKQYPVYIGKDAISEISPFLMENFPSLTKILIITDGNVGDRYLDLLKNTLETFKPSHFVVPNGEEAKTFDVYHECLTYALEQKLDRKSMILAFGGGAVGDLSGFVAATYMRGIPFIQLPTTILAHDSAVGGKVAINHPLGKNMIGAFYQPEAVFYDLNFLQSLPTNERRSGFAEVIKHGLIRDSDFYEWLLENIEDLDQLSVEQLSYFLEKGIRIKGAVVSEDEKEAGVRAHLNFGHTLGHAIEGEVGYGNITHGEGVIIGMLFALQISKELLNLSFDIEGLEEWLKRLGYQTTIPIGLNKQRLLDRMKQDKKSVGEQVKFVLLDKIATPQVYKLDDSFISDQLMLFEKKGGMVE